MPVSRLFMWNKKPLNALELTLKNQPQSAQFLGGEKQYLRRFAKGSEH